LWLGTAIASIFGCYGNVCRGCRYNGLSRQARMEMKVVLSALLAGSLFGFGLAVSEMIDPGRVIGFLDVMGRWDPTLLFVMGGALAVTVPGFPLILRQRRPALGERFSLPTKTKVDLPLVMGAAIFGAGWGLAGFCPGPALAALVTLAPPVFVFVAAMVLGQALAARVEKRWS
jgi:uncharacterized membrane protein YedE/YeeE